MAVVIKKSGAITNRDSSPRKLANPALAGGMLRNAVGTVELASGDSIGSTLVLAQVPSNARVSQVLLSCDAITDALADIGLYKNTSDGSAVVDADFFASAQALTSALKNADVTHESGEYGVEDVEKTLWQALGLTSDPGLIYDVVATLTVAAGAAGTVSLQVNYGI